MPIGEMEVTQRRADVAVAHEPLDRVHVDAGLEKMSGEGVARAAWMPQSLVIPARSLAEPKMRCAVITAIGTSGVPLPGNSHRFGR